MTYKTHVRILVQNLTETGEQFANRIEKYCDYIESNPDFQNGYDLSIQFTASSNDRQAANIVFKTKHRTFL